MATVDLHLHTTFSDGRLSPTQLVSLLVERGIKVAAITDHDSTEGLTEAFKAKEAFPELTLIPGVELSAEAPGTEIHITPDDPDKRDYKVSFSKIKKVLNFDTDFSIEDGVDEIYKALKRGEIKFGDIEHNTVKYYKYLFDAEKKINALKINGNLFYI